MSPFTLNLEASKKDLSTKCALDEISKSVAKCKKIVVVTGAGISCSSGIPDFRSSDGLYNLVKSRFPDIVLKGRDLFDASLFRDPESTAAFFCFISQLKQKIDLAEPTATHDFLRILETKGKLLRSYTQNIDGLEERVGLVGHSGVNEGAKTKGKGKSSTLKQCRNVQLHGDIHRVRCQACSAEYPCTEEHLRLFNEGLSPDCPDCLQRSDARVARSARALRVGSLRPAIVLYDEAHPLGDEIGIVQGSDVARKPDMLIIMGTSLKVHGLKKLVKEFAKAVHSHKISNTSSSSSSGSTPTKVRKTSSAKALAGKVIFVNKTPPGAEWAGVIDYHVSGETDQWTQRVVEDWKKMFPTDWEVQQTLLSSGIFKAAKETHGEAQVVAKGRSKAASKSNKDSKKKAPIGASDDEEENIPPVLLHPDPMILSTPDAHRLLKSKPKSNITESPSHMVISPAPVSPSKRSRTQSHYSDEAQAALEASPSKRRLKTLPDSGLDSEQTERRILFGRDMVNQTMTDALVDDMAEDEDDLNMGDLSMQSPQKPKVPSRPKSRVVIKPMPKSRSGLRRMARMQSTAMTGDGDVFAA
ncbi:DHS-like NAD/FAD-binding domain-containing protein [Lentinula raphanica]|nr:DHS-like NAD/FAD-binding domain-containing protein [Lentinula raphanica]